MIFVIYKNGHTLLPLPHLILVNVHSYIRYEASKPVRMIVVMSYQTNRCKDGYMILRGDLYHFKNATRTQAIFIIIDVDDPYNYTDLKM